MDDIEAATEFYCAVLGFERASNADGPMDYPGAVGRAVKGIVG